MAIDIRGIEVALVKTVREYVGSKLSTYGSGVNTKPSVIRSRLFSTGTRETTPTFPDYPYSSVDYTRITDDGYELTERYFKEDGSYVYRTHKLASFSIRFFGTSKDDVFSLCNEMHMMLEIDEVRAMIKELSPTETAVRSKTDPVFVATNMEDKYREVASFDVVMAVLDEVTLGAENSVGTIENVEFDTAVPQEGVQGGLYVDYEEDAILNVEVDTDIPPS